MKNCCGWRDVRDMNHMSDGDFEMTITTHSPRRKASKKRNHVISYDVSKDQYICSCGITIGRQEFEEINVWRFETKFTVEEVMALKHEKELCHE
ncbi:hypothetical protein DRH14_05310 [Candidatus Shapirobacteria bacterium]|nr:MAG: hypothetical protein DRH14_05310 [Candidatus Shapirobacteria bacterium]